MWTGQELAWYQAVGSRVYIVLGAMMMRVRVWGSRFCSPSVVWAHVAMGVGLTWQGRSLSSWQVVPSVFLQEGSLTESLYCLLSCMAFRGCEFF